MHLGSLALLKERHRRILTIDRWQMGSVHLHECIDGDRTLPDGFRIDIILLLAQFILAIGMRPEVEVHDATQRDIALFSTTEIVRIEHWHLNTGNVQSHFSIRSIDGESRQSHDAFSIFQPPAIVGRHAIVAPIDAHT